MGEAVEVTQSDPRPRSSMSHCRASAGEKKEYTGSEFGLGPIWAQWVLTRCFVWALISRLQPPRASIILILQRLGTGARPDRTGPDRTG